MLIKKVYVPLKYQINQKITKTMKNLLIASIIIFSLAFTVYVASPTKEIAGKEYKIFFGTPIKTIK